MNTERLSQVWWQYSGLAEQKNEISHKNVDGFCLASMETKILASMAVPHGLCANINLRYCGSTVSSHPLCQ